MKKLLTSLTCISLLLFSFSAQAAEVTVQNTSTSHAKLYSNDGRGWTYEGTIRAGSRVQAFQTNVGDSWGFSDPYTTRIDILKEVTVRNWGTNSLVLYDRDLNRGIAPPAPVVPPGPPIVQRKLTVTNYSSKTVTVYANHGSGWHSEGTVPAGSKAKYPVTNGEGWGINDPFRGGISLIKQITIKSYDPLPGMTVNDRDLGITQPILPPAPIIPAPPTPPSDVSISFDNKSIHKGNIYRKTGPFSKTYIGTVGSWGLKTFRLTPGDSIVISKPGSIKTLKYRVPSSSQTFQFKPRS